VTDIDKAVALARDTAWLDDEGVPSPHPYPTDAQTLARAVLAMAAVVEAARFYVNTPEGMLGASVRGHRALVAAVAALDAEARRG
jgi:hypothetical protein